MINNNKDKEETFECYWNRNFKEFEDNLTHLFNCDFREILKLKQLHDKEIKYWKDLADNQSEQSIILARELKELNDFDTEKDKQISQLQRELQDEKTFEFVLQRQVKELQSQLKNKECECVIVEDRGKYTVGYFDITKSLKTLLDEKTKELQAKISELEFRLVHYECLDCGKLSDFCKCPK